MQAFIKEVLGLDMKVVVRSDSSAAIGMANRTGPGRVKHLQLKSLFVQELVAQGKVKLEKIGTKVNTADLGTKHLTFERMRELLDLLDIELEESSGLQSQSDDVDEADVVMTSTPANKVTKKPKRRLDC